MITSSSVLRCVIHFEVAGGFKAVKNVSSQSLGTNPLRLT